MQMIVLLVCISKLNRNVNLGHVNTDVLYKIIVILHLLHLKLDL